jgi:hypothetical protein
MPPAEFKPTILASERPQTHATDRLCRVQLTIFLQVFSNTFADPKHRPSQKKRKAKIRVALCRTAKSVKQISTDRTVLVLEFRWEEFFASSFPPRSALDPTQPSLQWIPGLFPKVKATGVDRQTRSSAEVKNKWRFTFNPSLCLLSHIR